MPGQDGMPGQGGMPGQRVPSPGGVPSQGEPGPASRGMPGQQWTGDGQGQQKHGLPRQRGRTALQPGSPMRGLPITPVNQIETRVTGRRVVQYIIDYLITGVIASAIISALDRVIVAVNAVLLGFRGPPSSAW